MEQDKPRLSEKKSQLIRAIENSGLYVSNLKFYRQQNIRGEIF
jgi:hypothetical protein